MSAPATVNTDGRTPEREAAARLQLARELAGDGEREASVRLHEPDKMLRVDLEQPRVPHRAHGGRARRAGQEPELAERGAAPDLAQDAPVVAGEHLQATGDDDEEPVGRLTGAKEPLAGGEAHRAPALAQLFDRVRRGAAQQGRLAEGVAGRDRGHAASLRRAWNRSNLASAAASSEPQRRRPSRVSTTFPVFCPVSTYLVASTTSSSG